MPCITVDIGTTLEVDGTVCFYRIGEDMEMNDDCSSSRSA